ncbi:hypothetical protein TNCV_3143861 [Trichonephila clavipes]|nr:hypothetical protein TNCV_3143861 [Trichonephila clavipes]
MANLPTDMELEQAESQRNATRTPSPQLTSCEQLKYSKAQLAKMETFRRCKQACVDALMMMLDHHPDEPFYVRALIELHDIEEAMALAVSDIDSFEPCIIPGCPHHEKTPQNSPLKSSPDTSYSGKRKEISNFEYPPKEKRQEKLFLNLPITKKLTCHKINLNCHKALILTTSKTQVPSPTKMARTIRPVKMLHKINSHHPSCFSSKRTTKPKWLQ